MPSRPALETIFIGFDGSIRWRVDEIIVGGDSMARNIKKLMCGVAPVALMFAASLAAPVRAADLPVAPVAPAVETPAGFEGFYIGGHRGYGSAEYSGHMGGDTRVSFDNAGYLLGLHAGYNWLISPNFYAGVEGDITVAPRDAAMANPTHDTEFVGGHLTGIASLRGRLGYGFDRTLIYATGGIAFASSNASGGHTLQHNKRQEIVVGPVAGAGVEWLLTPNLALRGEGLYYWFDQTQRGNGGSGQGGINNAWMLRGGASWYLNRPTDDAAFTPVMMSEAFSGFYIGAHTGYGSAEYSGHMGGDTRVSFDNAGYLVGAHAGYNWRYVSNTVIGVEGDITVAPWDAAMANPNHDTEYVGGHLTGIASLRGRLGYAFDRSLIYATGGVAFASSNAAGGHTLQFNKHAEIVVGPVAGAGFEWLVTPSVGLRAEGLYYWFDQKQGGNGGSGNGGIQNTWMARAGASYYFDAASDAGNEPILADFRGFYFGGHAGYGSAEYEGVTTDVANPHKFGPDPGGYLIGAHVGYNWQTANNILFGGEWDMTLAPWDAAAADLPDDSTNFVSGHLTGIASLRGRLGYAFDRSLIFATGGIAFASSHGAGGYTLQHNKKAEIEIGPVAGAGYEWMATQNVSLRAEGLYYWFDQKQGGNGGTGYGGIQNTWMARVGASWYYN